MVPTDLQKGGDYNETPASMAYARVLIVCGLLLLVTTQGCGSLSRELSKTARTAIEQLLLTQAVERSLADLTIPLPPQETIAVDTLGLTPDQEFLRLALAGRLSELGSEYISLRINRRIWLESPCRHLGRSKERVFSACHPYKVSLFHSLFPKSPSIKKLRSKGSPVSPSRCTDLRPSS